VCACACVCETGGQFDLEILKSQLPHKSTVYKHRRADF